MPAYVIADNLVHDAELYSSYQALAAPTHVAHGSKILAAGGRAESLGGDWTPRRVVIVEFETYEKAKAWAESAEYGAATALRDRAADVRVIVVEGR